MLKISIICLGLLAAMAASYFYGASSQKETIASLNGTIRLKNDTITILQSDIRDVNKLISEQEAKGKEYKQKLNDAQTQLKEAEKDRKKSDAAWEKRLFDLQNKPECAVLQEHICEQAMDY